MRPRHNVANEAKTRQNQAQKRSLLLARYHSNEHFKPVFNKVLASAVVMLMSHRLKLANKLMEN